MKGHPMKLRHIIIDTLGLLAIIILSLSIYLI